MEERETHDELRSESWIVLSQRLENPDSCSLLDAVGDVDVDVGDVPWRGEKWESEISRIRNETSFLFALRIRLDDSLSEDIGDGVQIQPGSLLSVLCNSSKKMEISECHLSTTFPSPFPTHRVPKASSSKRSRYPRCWRR